jgi:NAD(P) transhydrogenase subunit alpha
MAQVFIPRERRRGENRVAATPETVRRMIQQGFSVVVEQGAGAGAFFPDADFEAAGARLTADPVDAWVEADVVLKVAPLGLYEGLPGHEMDALKPGAVLISFLAPHRELDTVRHLAAGNVSALAMELVPRVTRAQSIDALSSQASVAGYKAALVAAARVPRYFPLLMTAAGTIPAGRVVVLGAGVAGLQALATARRLGAVVEVSDVRAAVREQVESLGGRFIDLPAAPSGEGAGGYARELGEDFLRQQREMLTERLAASDAVITTAQVPGKPAPRLVTAAMVEAMRPGSVIIDLAAEQGGNCELSQPDQEVVHNGVTILAPTNLAATLAHDASSLYARNVLALLRLLGKDGQVTIDTTDEVVAGTLLTHAGQVQAPVIAALLDREVSAG